jgi:glycosyltransferase involved in cell wall biosynthesis
MKPPFFSVIIATFNRADMLKVALDSLVSQTYKNFEVLVCDDGSTDNTAAVVEGYKQKLDLTHIWEENWGGPARPRNNGIKASKGDWICFLDSDDLWYPEKLERCSLYLENNNLIYHDLDIYSAKHNGPKGTVGSWSLKNDVFIDLMVRGNAINNSSVIVKKELLLKVNCFSEEKELVFVEDYDCWLKISLLDNKFYFIPQSLGGYWMGNNASAASERTIKSMEFLYNKFHVKLKDKDMIQSLSNLNFTNGLLYYAMKDFNSAIGCFKKALYRKTLFRKYQCLKFIMICNILKLTR